MNLEQSADRARAAKAEPTHESGLPVLTDERIGRIEESLFAEISRARVARRGRRTGMWIVGGAAAAVIVVAAVIAPGVGTLIGGGGASDESGAAPSLVDPAVGGAEDSAVGGSDAAQSGVVGDGAGAVESTQDARSGDLAGDGDRAVITTASATVVVDDIAAAAAMIADAASSRDGYVESMSIGRSGEVVPIDPMTGMVDDTSMPYPYPPDGAWITVRVPADGLQSLVDQLAGLGEVTASSINRQDVTEVTIDLEARVEAAQASVDRLEELMAQAGSLTDLIAAESALAERQATLESYQQQLEYYETQIAMSTLTVTLVEPAETVEADPAGFADGLAAGWNGLVATLNGIVIALGFLIPWIAVAAVAALIVWGVVRLVRRRRAERSATKMPASEADRGNADPAPAEDR